MAVKNVNLVDFGDLLRYAESIGIFWNKAHDILVNDGVVPMYESPTQDLYIGVAEDYGWCAESSRIIDGFLKENNITSCVLTM